MTYTAKVMNSVHFFDIVYKKVKKLKETELSLEKMASRAPKKGLLNYRTGWMLCCMATYKQFATAPTSFS